MTLALGLSSQAQSAGIARSDILLHIVTQCVDPSRENYCSNCMLPRADASCSGVADCKKTNEVWALNPKYVAIRDIKMCGCPSSFVHGLAMPRNIVTGVEDLNREEDIWQFAWDVGVERIEPGMLALVVNPQSERTQNQLHVHMLKLDKNARESFVDYSHAYIQSLEGVWSTAKKMADSIELSDYGVLVAKASAKQYIVLVTRHSPESAFTVWNCGN
jgi:CDP-diacylglycerol pyrophosphatase